HARVEALDLRRGVDVEQRIGRVLALEADRAAVELEIAPGEIIVAAHQLGAPREARCVGQPADLKIGPPAAVDPEPDDLEIAPRKLEVELPRMKVGDLDHVFGIETAFTHSELGTGSRRACVAELEAALVEPKIA